MLDGFLRHSVDEVNLLIARAKERLEQQEAAAQRSRAKRDEDVIIRMKQGFERLKAYRSYVANLD